MLAPILMVALLLRIGFLPDAAYKGDMEHFAVWVDAIRHVGLFDFYDQSLRFAKSDRTYPQLSTIVFAAIGAIHKPIWGLGTTMHDPAFTASGWSGMSCASREWRETLGLLKIRPHNGDG